MVASDVEHCDEIVIKKQLWSYSKANRPENLI